MDAHLRSIQLIFVLLRATATDWTNERPNEKSIKWKIMKRSVTPFYSIKIFEIIEHIDAAIFLYFRAYIIELGPESICNVNLLDLKKKHSNNKSNYD